MKNFRYGVWLALLFVFGACTPGEERTTETARGAGFEQITVTGRSVFGCGDDDYFFGRNFVAMRDTHPVSGTVCCGFFKKCTIRY